MCLTLWTAFRFDDIPCLDSSRVVLQGYQTDYIHANYITFQSGRYFICAQVSGNYDVVEKNYDVILCVWSAVREASGCRVHLIRFRFGCVILDTSTGPRAGEHMRSGYGRCSHLQMDVQISSNRLEMLWQ